MQCCKNWTGRCVAELPIRAICVIPYPRHMGDCQQRCHPMDIQIKITTSELSQSVSSVNRGTWGTVIVIFTSITISLDLQIKITTSKLCHPYHMCHLLTGAHGGLSLAVILTSITKQSNYVKIETSVLPLSQRLVTIVCLFWHLQRLIHNEVSQKCNF